MQTLLTQSFQTTIEQIADNYQYGYFITFVKKQYSHHIITKQEVIKKIKNIMNNDDIEFHIFKVVNVGDSVHFNTIHYHCVVFSNKQTFINAIILNRISKISETTINIKTIFNVTGALGYIRDKHNILKIYTNNQLLKSDIRKVGQKIETQITLYFLSITLKIIRGRHYTPT